MLAAALFLRVSCCSYFRACYCSPFFVLVVALFSCLLVLFLLRLLLLSSSRLLLVLIVLAAALLILLATIFLVALVVIPFFVLAVVFFFALAAALLLVCYFSLSHLLLFSLSDYYFLSWFWYSKMLGYLMDINVDGYPPMLKYDIWLIYFLISLQDIASEFFYKSNNNNQNRWITNGQIIKTDGYWKIFISAQHWLPPGLWWYSHSVPQVPMCFPSISPKASHLIPFPWSKFFPLKPTLLRPKGKGTLLSILWLCIVWMFFFWQWANQRGPSQTKRKRKKSLWTYPKLNLQILVISSLAQSISTNLKYPMFFFPFCFWIGF